MAVVIFFCVSLAVLASMKHKYLKLQLLCCCFCWCHSLFCPHKCISLIIFGQVVRPNILECQLPTPAIIGLQCQHPKGHRSLPFQVHLYTCPTFVMVLHHIDTSFGGGTCKVPSPKSKYDMNAYMTTLFAGKAWDSC